MNIKRYVARTSREALAMVRAELGDDAVVLKNRSVPEGVEILAVADDAPAGPAPQMSTVNFETYVRDRQARRLGQQSGESWPASSAPAPATQAAPAPAPAMPAAPVPAFAPPPVLASAAPILARVASPPAAPETVPSLAPERPAAASVDSHALMSELREMRGLLTSQIESMHWFDDVRRRPAQVRMLRQLLEAGFSTSLARRITDHLPADFGDSEAANWLSAVLQRNLRTRDESVFDDGGVFALLGPTGVGKTTTAAKIAARFALRHGADSIGLITADVYRVGAQDQLRTFGKMLGVPVHVAHDTTALFDFLSLFERKRLVLIDTAGIGQRDQRVTELLATLGTTQVRRMVVLNAAMQSTALEQVITAYDAARAEGVILSKTDEAAQLGGALDCLIRHRLTLAGVANGQRVPEDWHFPDAQALVAQALAGDRPVNSGPFALDDSELALMMTAGAGAGASATAGSARV